MIIFKTSNWITNSTKNYLAIRIVFIMFFSSVCSYVFSQNSKIPDWFLSELEANIGSWTTNNKKYQSEQEPYDGYRITWTWGNGNKSIVGKLYGLINGKPTTLFWEFRKYWDATKQSPCLIQFGSDGTIGIGHILRKDQNETQLEQIFTNPDGTQYKIGHKNHILSDTSYVGTSFAISEKGKWAENRSYTWVKHNNIMQPEETNVLHYFNALEGLWEGMPQDTSFISVLEFNKRGHEYFIFVNNDLLSKTRNPFSHYEGVYFFNPATSQLEFTTINKNEIHYGSCKVAGDTLFHYASVSGKSKTKSYTSAIVKKDSNTLLYFASYSQTSELPELIFENPLIYNRRQKTIRR